jgi:uroporphyrinogen decarboxylase
MTSRERVLTTLQHKEPDRIPFDLGSTILTGITRIVYRNLVNYLGLPLGEAPVVDVIQQLAGVHEEVLQRCRADLRGIYLKDPSTWRLRIEEEDGYMTFIDQWGIGWRMPKERGYYYDMYLHPLAGATVEDIDRYPWPDPSDRERVKGLREEARRLYEETDYAIIMGSPFGAGLMEMVTWMQGYDDGYINLIRDPILTEKLLDKILELKMRFWEIYLSEVGEYISIVIDGDDIGFQETPMFSVEMYRQYMKPRQTALYAHIKKLAQVKVLFHSCGSVYDLLPDIIETGIDILNPVQVSARGMETKRLKREFGDALTFWGGIDTQEVLPRGTPEQVREEVKRRIDDLAPDGGYVFNTVHNIQADVPPQNIVAMWEAFEEYGRY